MKTLFPEMDQAIRDDRKAAQREKAQHARAWLRGKDLSWLINRLIDEGPETESNLCMELMEEEPDSEKFSKRVLETLIELHSLWTVRKLWRRSVGIHPGSGEESFIYGIRGVHAPPKG